MGDPLVDGVATASFDAPSLIEGAALAGTSWSCRPRSWSTCTRQACGCASIPTSTPNRCRRPRGSRAGRKPCRAAAPERRVRGIPRTDGGGRFWQHVLEAQRLGRTAVWRIRCGTTPAIRIRQSTEPGRSKPHPPRRGAAGRGGRAGGLGEASGPSGCATPIPTATRSTWCRARRRREDRDADWQAVFKRDGVLPRRSPTQTA